MAEGDFTHNVVHVAAILFTFLLAVLQLIFGFFSYAGYALFDNTLEGLSQEFKTEAFPSYPFPVIGLIIYILQVPWTVYNITLIWREGPTDYLYKTPNTIPIITNIGMIVSIAVNIAWFFLWDQKKLIPEIVMLAGGAVFMTVALGALVYVFFLNAPELEKIGKLTDIFIHRLLVQNGMVAFTAWFFLETSLHSSVVAHYEGNMSDEDASTMALGLYAFCVIFTIVMHDFVLEKYFRYAILNYAVWIALLIPILVNFDGNKRNYIIALIILLVIIVFFIVKMVRFCRTVCPNEPAVIAAPVKVVSTKAKTKSAIKKKRSSKKVEADVEVDGVINLTPPDTEQAVSTYRIIQTATPREIFTTPANQVEVLNTHHHCHAGTVPVYSAPRPVEVLNMSTPSYPPVEQIYFQPGSCNYHHMACSSPRPRPTSSMSDLSSSITIDPVSHPSMLTMNKKLSGTPMGVMNVPKSVLPAAQPAHNCCSMMQPQYESCQRYTLNQPTGCGCNGMRY